MIKYNDIVVKAIVGLFVTAATKAVYNLVKRAMEPVLCPDCKHEMVRNYHSIYFCINCNMRFNLRSDGAYPLTP